MTIPPAAVLVNFFIPAVRSQDGNERRAVYQMVLLRNVK